MATEQPASIKSMSATGIPAERRGADGIRGQPGRQLSDGPRIPSAIFRAEKGARGPSPPPRADAPAPKPQRHRGRGEAPEQGATSQRVDATAWG